MSDDARARRSNALVRYRQRCGTRSFLFQAVALGWTGFCLVACVLFVVMYGSRHEGQYLSLGLGISEHGSRMIVSLCCPFAAWFLVAFPLAIAALATFNSDKAG